MAEISEANKRYLEYMDEVRNETLDRYYSMRCVRYLGPDEQSEVYETIEELVSELVSMGRTIQRLDEDNERLRASLAQ